ncbi:MAG: HAD family hydrolase [Actinomycetota bacterium]
MSFEAVVFDLFGTLVPEFSKTDFFGSVRDMAQVLGADPGRFEDAWRQTAEARQTGGFATVEDNVRHICASLGLEPPDDAVAAALDLRLELYRTWFHPRRGALETLTELAARGYPVGLVSMCAPDAPAMWRASALAPFVDVEVFSSEVGLRKPDAAIYRYATDGLGVDPAACVYCGDGAYGELSGAEAVGMTSYLIADPAVDVEVSLTPEREEWNGARVSDLRELLAFLPGR